MTVLLYSIVILLFLFLCLVTDIMFCYVSVILSEVRETIRIITCLVVYRGTPLTI